MGTHPIFESDFDCLTDCRDWKMNQRRWNEANGFTVAEIKAKLAEWREVFPVNQRSPGKNNKAARSAVVNELLPEIPMREEGGGRRHILRLDMQAEIGVIYQEQDTRKIDTSKLNTTRSRMTTDGSILKENVPMVPAVSAGRDRSSSRASTGTGGGGARSRSGSRVANSQSKPAGRDSARRTTKMASSWRVIRWRQMTGWTPSKFSSHFEPAVWSFCLCHVAKEAKSSAHLDGQVLLPSVEESRLLHPPCRRVERVRLGV